jgi:CRP/FNR family transcriptional regulator
MDNLTSFDNMPLFNGLSKAEINEFMKIAVERSFKKGDVIFYEHAEGNELFILVEGSVSIQLVAVPDEDKVPILTLRSGDIFGELAIIDSGPRSATVVCEEDVRVMLINKNDLDPLFEKDNHLGMVIYRNISLIVCDRIRKTNVKLVNNITWGII